METLYPISYGTRMVTLDQLRAKHEPQMHPEFARRLFNWIEAQDGQIGIGGGRRTIQPNKPGFAPSIRSTFHGDQDFPSGTFYAAVDLVARSPGRSHRAPRTDECPQQGSPEAERWGVHINVGTPGSPGYESWHMQPVELDGWGRWMADGQPDLEPMHLYSLGGNVATTTTTTSVEVRLIQLEGFLTVRYDGTIPSLAEVLEARSEGRVDVVPRAEVPDNWAFCAQVIANAGGDQTEGGAAVAARFRSVGGEFPQA